MIQYLGIWKSFDVPVLRGVDLRVASGETLALVGPSGTGKSVLLKTTIGLLAPDRGDIRIDGVSVVFGGARALAAVRRRVGYVFQSAALFDSATVYENVASGIPEAELKRLDRRTVANRVADALEHVNLPVLQVARQRPAELSGGMRKRVGIARAFIARPQIILWDEPVTGLDPVNAAHVHRLIQDLGQEIGATSVVVTHDVEGALAICDRIALLEGGRIRFAGTPSAFRDSADMLVRSFLQRELDASPALAATGD